MTFRLPKAACAALLLIAGLAGPAAAEAGQSAPRISRAGEPNTAEDIRVLHEFSSCAARRDTARARSVLAMDFRTAAYQRRLLGLADDNRACLASGQLRFSYVLFAGGMAETLLRQDAGAGDLAARVAYDPARPAIRARDESEVMFLCTVRAAPEQVAALLRTDAASDREAELLRELAPQAARCLPEGSRVGLNRVGLRALLALAAHRLSEHNLRTASR